MTLDFYEWIKWNFLPHLHSFCSHLVDYNYWTKDRKIMETIVQIESVHRWPYRFDELFVLIKRSVHDTGYDQIESGFLAGSRLVFFFPSIILIYRFVSVFFFIIIIGSFVLCIKHGFDHFIHQLTLRCDIKSLIIIFFGVMMITIISFPLETWTPTIIMNVFNACNLFNRND